MQIQLELFAKLACEWEEVRMVWEGEFAHRLTNF